MERASLDRTYPTRLEHELFCSSTERDREGIKKRKLQLFVADFEYLLSDRETGGWLIHTIGGLRTETEEILQQDIMDVLEGVKNLRAKGYDIEYVGPNTLQDYYKSLEFKKNFVGGG